MASRFSVLSIFKAGDRITAPVRRMTASVSRMTRSMERGFTRVNRRVKKFTGALKKGAVIGTASLLIMGAAIKNLITTGADFGRAIGSAAAKFPDKIKRGTKAFNDLIDSAREVGATTEFTATQAARGLAFLAKAGFTASFSMKALPNIVDFATASELEFAEAADIASDALGAFGLDSDDLGEKMRGLDRVMDVLSLTANSANADVTQLFESVKKGGPVATTAGQSIETYAAILGFLASSGIKASEAGTAVKNVTLGLGGIGNKAAVTLKRLGIQLQDNNGDFRDQLDVLDDLRGSLKGFGSAQRLTILNAIFGKLSLAAASKLLDDSGKSVRAFRGELEKAGGSSKRTAAFIRNDVKGSLDGLSSAIEGVKISIFTLNEGPLKDAIDGMTLWVRENEKLIATNIGGFLLDLIENFGNIVTWIKRIGKFLIVFFTLTAVLNTLIAVLTLVNLVMAANPITLIILGIFLLIAAVAAVIIWWDELTEAFRNSGEAMDALIVGVGILLGPIGLLIAAAALIFKHWEPIKQFFADLWDGIVGIFDSAVEKVMAIVDLITGAVGDVIDTISSIGGGVGKFFGFVESDDSAAAGAGRPQVVGPQERAARTIQENRTTNTTEVTIRDETGRAEVTGPLIGTGLKLEQSGVF